MRELKNTKGQTMVEFALIIALFLAILFGIVEFGRAWYYSNHLGNSVRAAARYGAVYANSNGVNHDSPTIKSGTRTYANAEISGYMKASPGGGPGQFVVNVNIFRNNSTFPGSLAKQGDTLRVSATYNYQILTGSIIPNFGVTQITRSASMPIE
jgi:Flp pilus assembly protein TadG